MAKIFAIMETVVDNFILPVMKFVFASQKYKS